VKYGIIIQSVTDFLELIKQTLQYTTLDGNGSHKIEDQTIALLAIAVNTTHALLKPIRIPEDVIVEQDVAALEVDPFASRLGGDRDLNGTVSELLLGEQACARVVTGSWPHAAMDGADAEAPGLETVYQIVKRVLEFGEEQQPLFRVVEETLGPKEVFQPRQLRLRTSLFYLVCLLG